MNYIILLSLVIFISCTSSTEKKDESPKFGEIKLSYGNPPSNVISLEIILSRNDMDSIASHHTLSEQETITLEGIPSGSWNLKIDAYDNDTTIIYTGTTQIFVEADKTNQVSITLNVTTGNIEIDITFDGRTFPDSITFIRYLANESDVNYVLSSIETDDKGYASTGVWNNNVMLVKLDRYGNISWKKEFGGESSDLGYDITRSNSGGFIISGKTTSFSDEHMSGWMIKASENGDMLWNKVYNDYYKSELHDIIELDNGNIITSGYFKDSASVNDESLLIMAVNPNGDIMWKKEHFKNSNVLGYSIQNNFNFGIIILALTGEYSNSELTLLKLDFNGNESFSKILPISDIRTFHPIMEINSKGEIIVSISKEVNNQNDIYVSKLSSIGEPIWEYTFGGLMNEYVYSMNKNSLDEFVFSTSRVQSLSPSDYQNWLFKINDDGILINEGTYGFPNLEEGLNIISTSDDGYFISGMTHYGPAMFNGYILKLNNFLRLEKEDD